MKSSISASSASSIDGTVALKEWHGTLSSQVVRVRLYTLCACTSGDCSRNSLCAFYNFCAICRGFTGFDHFRSCHGRLYRYRGRRDGWVRLIVLRHDANDYCDREQRGLYRQVIAASTHGAMGIARFRAPASSTQALYMLATFSSRALGRRQVDRTTSSHRLHVSHDSPMWRYNLYAEWHVL